MIERQHFGNWTTDSAGLPCFDLLLEDDQIPDAPFRHLISTGHLSAMADRWGNVNLATTEGGFLWLNSPDSSFSRSSLYMMMKVDGELVSLLYSELTKREKIRIGTGYIEYWGEIKIRDIHLRIVQHIFAYPDRRRAMQGRFTLANLSLSTAELPLEIRSDVTASRAHGGSRPGKTRPSFTAPGRAVFTRVEDLPGGVFLIGDTSWNGAAQGSTLRLEGDVTLVPGEVCAIDCATGYGLEKISLPTPKETQARWRAKLRPYDIDAPAEWMRQECLWTAGQLMAFSAYDSSVDEHYLALGGYGWPVFPVREVSETSMVLASGDPGMAEEALRFTAKTQLASGDIPKVHTMRRDRTSTEFESDNELWFVLGCCETVAQTGDTGFLDKTVPFWDDGEDTMWEHLKRAFYWTRDHIGRGSHGLVLIREGDWNDYLSLMGSQGRGESVMNSGMACRAFSALARLARQREEIGFALELEKYTSEVRAAVAAAFDEDWFVCGYDDTGKAVGSRGENRLFLNAQSWAALGQCGTVEQRRRALRSAIEKCHTKIGLMLMSRPYSSPAPETISWCAIPAGEGENAGIWPQTIHWAVWALAEEGMVDEALIEWQCGTLRNHARQCPHVPFGIFNGPDCFSSVWAGPREGMTQLQLLNRAHFIPMNPMVAWQGFALRKILTAQKKIQHKEASEISSLPLQTANTGEEVASLRS